MNKDTIRTAVGNFNPDGEAFIIVGAEYNTGLPAIAYQGEEAQLKAMFNMIKESLNVE